MRLSAYPFVVVRISCSRCARKGHYRLARLADKYGAEVELPILLGHLAAGCDKRDVRRHVYDFCGAYFPDLNGANAPDKPPPLPIRLRVVK